MVSLTSSVLKPKETILSILGHNLAEQNNDAQFRLILKMLLDIVPMHRLSGVVDLVAIHIISFSKIILINKQGNHPSLSYVSVHSFDRLT